MKDFNCLVQARDENGEVTANFGFVRIEAKNEEEAKSEALKKKWPPQFAEKESKFYQPFVQVQEVLDEDAYGNLLTHPAQVCAFGQFSGDSVNDVQIKEEEPEQVDGGYWVSARLWVSEDEANSDEEE